MRRLLLALAVALFAATAHAGGTTPTKVVTLTVRWDGWVIFEVEPATRASNPNRTQPYSFGFTATGAEGKNLYNQLLAAYHAGSKVVVTGVHGCSDIGGGQTVEWIWTVTNVN
jgi:hypothetical protein